MEERDSRYLRIDLKALPSELADALLAFLSPRNDLDSLQPRDSNLILDAEERWLVLAEPFQTKDERMIKVCAKRVDQRPCENRSRLIKMLATTLKAYIYTES